jgi:hypothetical protein
VSGLTFVLCSRTFLLSGVVYERRFLRLGIPLQEETIALDQERKFHRL